MTMSDGLGYHTFENSSQSSSYAATARAVVVEGIPDERRTSPIRRTFLLFVLFDLIAAFIMWVFYARMLHFDSLEEAMQSEILEYNFKTSMFDMVILALWRLIILELAYGIFKWQKPWAGGLATACTCVVCLLKIFYFKSFQNRSQNTSDVFDYVIVITSFVVTWIETWFLDFRVLPKERAAREVAALRDPATQPLLANNHHRMPASFAPSERYFSPIASTEASEDEDEAPPQGIAADGFDLHRHLSLAEEIFREGVRLIDDASEWKLGVTKDVGRIFTNRTLRRKIIYRMESVINAPCRSLYNDMVERATESPKWNSTLECVRKIATLDERTDVLYNVVKDLLGGAVSSRDFVLMRRWDALPDGRLAVASVSIEHPACPRVREHVRGQNGPCLVLFSPSSAGGAEATEFKWILDSDPKGWLPQRVVDQAMFSVMTDFVLNLHRHASTLPVNVSINSEDLELETEEQFLSTPSSPS